MLILVGCEESQSVCIEFRKLGHEAYSCDTQPCSGGHPEWHFLMDIFKLIHGGVFLTQNHISVEIKSWEAAIFFPPCTDLAVSGARYFEIKKKDGRQQRSIDFFMGLVNCGIPKTAIENPVGIMSTIYRKPDQIIQPWQFGHNESKSTCLWLSGFPKLSPTKIIPLPGKGYRDNQCPSGQNKLGPSPERAKMRSKTYSGIARAMAEQWSGDINKSSETQLSIW